MARHTFVVSGGLRVEIQPSKTESGAVLLSILHSSGDRIGCATIAASTAAVIAKALELEAVAAENAAQCCTTPRPDCMGMLVPSIGDGCKALREDLEALETLHRYRSKYLAKCHQDQVMGDTQAVQITALPVVDVAQVGA